jgi:hypothetical protein
MDSKICDLCGKNFKIYYYSYNEISLPFSNRSKHGGLGAGHTNQGERDICNKCLSEILKTINILKKE